MQVESSKHCNLFRWIVNDWNTSNVRIREPYMLFTSFVHPVIGPSHFVISVKPFIGFTFNLTDVIVMELLCVLLVLLNGISSVSFLWFGKNIASIKDDSTMHCRCLDLRKLYILNIYDDIIKWKHFRATGPLCVESLYRVIEVHIVAIDKADRHRFYSLLTINQVNRLLLLLKENVTHRKSDTNVYNIEECNFQGKYSVK